MCVGVSHTEAEGHVIWETYVHPFSQEHACEEGTFSPVGSAKTRGPFKVDPQIVGFLKIGTSIRYPPKCGNHHVELTTD